jgi:NAD(P)-dependent dehydrogenase (short-subunit alcohol dehydrogenase family)
MDPRISTGSLRRVALVTGASTGIGLATAKKLLHEGFFVVLSARTESLSRLAGAEFLRKYPHHWVRSLDVRDHGERHALINQIEKELGRLDILINNAAVIYRAPIEYTYEFECKEQMLVNFHAPLELIKCALPVMRRHGGGHIINVSSAAGFLAVPTMGLYAASKHALEAASEALFHELSPWNIKVTLIEPGFISSDSYKKARLSLAMDRAHSASAGAYAIQSNLITGLIDQATGMTSASPEDVALVIAKVVAMKKPPLRQLVTIDAKLLSFLKRFLPGRVYDWMVHHCLESIRRQIQAVTQTPAPNVDRWPPPSLPLKS